MVKRTEGVEVLCYGECSTVDRAADCRMIVERACRSLNCLGKATVSSKVHLALNHHAN
jgi:hypothetical protein